jgi:hypothetical protein
MLPSQASIRSPKQTYRRPHYCGQRHLGNPGLPSPTIEAHGFVNTVAIHSFVSTTIGGTSARIHARQVCLDPWKPFSTGTDSSRISGAVFMPTCRIMELRSMGCLSIGSHSTVSYSPNICFLIAALYPAYIHAHYATHIDRSIVAIVYITSPRCGLYPYLQYIHSFPPLALAASTSQSTRIQHHTVVKRSSEATGVQSM